MSGTPTDPPTNPDSINKRFDEVTEYLIRLIDEQIAIKQRLDVLEKPHDNSLARLCKLWDAYNAQMHKWMAKRTDEIYDFMIAAWRTNPSSKGGEWYAINPYQTSLDHGFLNQVHTFMESIGNKAQPKPVEPSFPDPRLAAPKPVPAPPAPPAAPPAPPAPPAGLPPPSAAPAPPMTYAVAAATVPDTDTSSAAAAGPSTSASPTAQQQASKKAKADAKAELGEAERILGYRIRGGMSFPPGKCEVLSRGQLEAVYGVMRGHEMDLKGRGQPSRFICWKCQNAGWLPQVHAIRDCPNPDQQPLPKKA